MKVLKFSAWAKTYGIEKLATKCDVGPHQVRSWMRGEASPRPERIMKIVSLSNDTLSFEEIVKETSRNK